MMWNALLSTHTTQKRSWLRTYDHIRIDPLTILCSINAYPFAYCQLKYLLPGPASRISDLNPAPAAPSDRQTNWITHHSLVCRPLANRNAINPLFAQSLYIHILCLARTNSDAHILIRTQMLETFLPFALGGKCTHTHTASQVEWCLPWSPTNAARTSCAARWYYIYSSNMRKTMLRASRLYEYTIS